MPGRHISDHQVWRYMESRKDGHTQAAAAARAGFSESTARQLDKSPVLPSQRDRVRRYRTRPDPFEDSAQRVATLRRHNAATEIQHLQLGTHGAAETLLSTASEIGAGLLVTGGYSHSRLRELVFGGVTAHVLRAAALPVLMAH